MMELQKRGVAAAVICSRPFETLARGQARVHGYPDLPLVVIDHPLGGVDIEGVRIRAGQAAEQLIKYLRQQQEGNK